MYGPVLQGELVRLRPLRPDDAALMIAWFEDIEVTRFIELRHPPSIEFEKEWVDKAARDPNSVIWAVEYEGRTVGTTGIHLIDWKHSSGTTGTLIGDKTVWGKGLARELMRLRARYAFTELPLRKLKSAYLAGNEASGKAQAAAGYQIVGRQRQERFGGGRWHDMILTEVLRDDWLKSNPV
jgi:ribosomal-protein-alanine N-acetyltransferase